MPDLRKEKHTGSVERRKIPMKEKIKQRKSELNKWARARDDSKSNVSEYKT